MGLCLVVLVAGGCRQDMHDQPRYKALAESDFFGDRRSARPRVEGTVARGQLRQDDHLYLGKVGEDLADSFPFAVDEAVLARGHQRYEIYCTPCHGQTGYGDGMVVRRGYREARSFHADRLRLAGPGYFYDVISRGFGAMPSYADQIPPRDRWAIVAYVRALQLSQHAGIDDVPEAERAGLMRSPPES